MIVREVERDQLPYCRRHGMATLAYSPLARGLLTGKIGPEHRFRQGDHRADLKLFDVENRRRVGLLMEKLRPVAAEHRITLAQLVIAWTVGRPGLTHALCGARNVGQARENAASGDVELTDAERKTLDAAADEYARNTPDARP